MEATFLTIKRQVSSAYGYQAAGQNRVRGLGLWSVGCTCALSVTHSTTAVAVCGLWRYISVSPLPFDHEPNLAYFTAPKNGARCFQSATHTHTHTATGKICNICLGCERLVGRVEKQTSNHINMVLLCGHVQSCETILTTHKRTQDSTDVQPWRTGPHSSLTTFLQHKNGSETENVWKNNLPFLCDLYC